jgi:hypothetical protein
LIRNGVHVVPQLCASVLPCEPILGGEVIIRIPIQVAEDAQDAIGDVHEERFVDDCRRGQPRDRRVDNMAEETRSKWTSP